MIFLRRSNSLSISSLSEPNDAPPAAGTAGFPGVGGILGAGGAVPFINEGALTTPEGALGGPEALGPGGSLGGGGNFALPVGLEGGPDFGGPFGGPDFGGPFGGPDFGGPFGGPDFGGPFGGPDFDGGPALVVAAAVAPGEPANILNNNDAAFSFASALVTAVGVLLTVAAGVISSTTDPFLILIPFRSFCALLNAFRKAFDALPTSSTCEANSDTLSLRKLTMFNNFTFGSLANALLAPIFF